MRVLSVASEVYPLAKTGGLADVASALPGALARLGVEVATLLPGYPSVIAALHAATPVHHDPALFGGPARLLRAKAAGLDLFVLDAPHLYARSGLYAGPQGDWPDNPIRFAALARVGAQIGQGLLPQWLPDVVHAHDWQTGLLPAYLYYDHLIHGSRRPATVFTLHNLAFQGQFPAALLPVLGLPDQAWRWDRVEHYGALGFLKAGLQLADRITTVSPTYAEEICTPEGGMGLDGLLRARRGVLTGIVNGIDTDVWNPETDPRLAARYSVADVEPRRANKAALQRRFGLAVDPTRPLIGGITRLSWQKGMDLLATILPDLLADGAQFVLLGSGDADLEARYSALTLDHQASCGVAFGYDEDLAHLIQGGADLLAVPSRFEPCGLTQLCAMRYGAVPLVCRVGGLADTVIDGNAAALAAGVATGFQAMPNSADHLLSTVRHALRQFQDAATWKRLQRNGLQTDVSWNQPAMTYATIFEELSM